jgi:hypothetical protein
VKNHGAYVSSVARTKPGDGDAPNAHGKLVSAAAQSDCGKPAGGGDDADEKKSDRGKADDNDDDGGATNHPSGKPDVTGTSLAATHGQAAAHLPTG